MHCDACFVLKRAFSVFFRFHINLKKDADVAFHFNPRFDQNSIVRNTLVNGCWGAEERHANGFPFAPGKMFDIKILCESDCYKVGSL